MSQISPGRQVARWAIRGYQLTMSSVVGRQCRYLPTCSDYADEAISRHGVWFGGWMATARLCRCHPLGGAGYDPPPASLEPDGFWYTPWRSARWRMPRDHDRAIRAADKA